MFTFQQILFLAVGEQLFEGCIKLDEKDKELLSQPSDTRAQDKKTHITLKDKLWPSKVIPYEIVFTGTKDVNKGKLEKFNSISIILSGKVIIIGFCDEKMIQRKWTF